mgnify:CR=1 FL=1|jgi:acetolactate decarboxylase
MKSFLRIFPGLRAFGFLNVSRCAGALLLGSSLLLGCTGQVAQSPSDAAVSGAEREVVFQTATIDALLAGVYDGRMSFTDLKKHGDFGIGTFQSLDGEMVALDGQFYQIKSDGAVYPVADSLTTPFAAVTFFDADTTFSINDTLSLEAFYALVDSILPSNNILYALKVEGTFPYLKARSVPAQQKPYIQLVEIVANQSEFEYQQARGVLVGFRLPGFVAGVNVPGYHLHFLSEGRDKGGHLLGARMSGVTVSLDYTPGLHLELQESEEYYGLNLEKDRGEELHKVEK